MLRSLGFIVATGAVVAPLPPLLLSTLLAALSQARMRASVGIGMLLPTMPSSDMAGGVDSAAKGGRAMGGGPEGRGEGAVIGVDGQLLPVVLGSGGEAAASLNARAAITVRTRTGSLFDGCCPTSCGVCWNSMRGGNGVGSMGRLSRVEAGASGRGITGERPPSTSILAACMHGF